MHSSHGHGHVPPAASYTSGAAAFYQGRHADAGAAAVYQGRQLSDADSSVLASGFSPRVYHMHPLAGDSMHHSTAHKRQTSSAKADHLPQHPPSAAEVAITIPASATWQDPSHLRPGQVEERGQLSQPIPAEVSRPLPEKARPKVKVDTREDWTPRGDRRTAQRGLGMGLSSAANSQLVQSLRKLPGGAVAALQSSLGAVLWRTGSAPSGRRPPPGGVRRTPSMVKSPTVLKNIHSLSSLPEDEEGGGSVSGHSGDSRRDLQTLGSMTLFALVLFLWLYKGRPLLSLLHPFPAETAQSPPGSIWVELLALLLLLGIVAALVRSAFPRLFARLRTAAAGGWEMYMDSGHVPGAFSMGWRGGRGQGWGHRAPGGGGGGGGMTGGFGDKRKSSFEGRGSWEYLGASRESPTARSPYDMSEPSSPACDPAGRALHCGVHTYSNGDRYEGEFYQGKCSGSGVYIFASSGRYEGDWVEGKYDGCGIETWLRGSRYRGQYRKGLREGYGVYRFYTGDVYAGMWSKGQSHGVGVQTCADGSKYVGEFQWGAKHGVGKYTFRNGDTYSGEYFADKMHGYGVYEFSNGHRYEGAWHEGRKQGLGVYTFRNGEERAGHWHLGALETRSTRSSGAGAGGGGGGATPSSPNAVNHSRVLHAVQEARRGASRAEHVLRVEDRVSKAVSAANRAAVAARVAASKALQMQGNAGTLPPARASPQISNDPGEAGEP